VSGGGTGAPVEVLLVEDDDEDYMLTEDVFSSIEGTRYTLHWVRDYGSALKSVEERHFDVCLVDYRLGAENGIDLVRELVANGHDLPVVVLTGNGDRDVDLEAAQAGAADYLVKGEITPALLERTLRYALRSGETLRALRESEADLRQSQRMDAIGQLAGGVAHDFNNMMTAVIGFSDLILARTEEAHPLRGHVEEIKRAGERASALTHQLLAFSRRQVLQPRVLDLNAVVTEVDTLLQRLIGANVELVSVLDPALEHVQADPGQLEQVILNLAINARDAMPAGGQLTIETANVELDADHASRYLDVEAGPYALLAVSDTGVGMEAETIAQIFEPFFTTKPEGKGTGLGLATVFGIVKQSGGDIGVYSEPNRGTTFKIYLPRVQAPVDRISPPTRRLEPPRGSETVLLVEDEELVRHLEREVLTEGGYTVLEARSVSHALELAEGHAGVIDLLVTDVVMPELNGPALAELLAERRPDIRILYTSGYPSNAISRQGVLAPNVAFLPKPLTPASLARKVREVLDAVPAAQATGERPGAAPANDLDR
jgi:two-component system cell cycle sensor histidine kinase/response regulator CckA